MMAAIGFNVTSLITFLLTDMMMVNEISESNSLQSKTLTLTQLLRTSTTSLLDPISHKQEDLSSAETEVYETLLRMQSVLSIHSVDDTEEPVFVWHPKYERNYVEMIRNCPFYPKLKALSGHFLVH